MKIVDYYYTEGGAFDKDAAAIEVFLNCKVNHLKYSIKNLILQANSIVRLCLNSNRVLFTSTSILSIIMASPVIILIQYLKKNQIAFVLNFIPERQKPLFYLFFPFISKSGLIFVCYSPALAHHLQIKKIRARFAPCRVIPNEAELILPRKLNANEIKIFIPRVGKKNFINSMEFIENITGLQIELKDKDVRFFIQFDMMNENSKMEYKKMLDQNGLSITYVDYPLSRDTYALLLSEMSICFQSCLENYDYRIAGTTLDCIENGMIPITVKNSDFSNYEKFDYPMIENIHDVRKYYFNEMKQDYSYMNLPWLIENGSDIWNDLFSQRMLSRK